MQHGLLPWLALEDLDEEQRALHAAITSSRRASSARATRLADDSGRLEGPFNALLHSPKLGARVHQLGDAVRFDSTLSAREREIAILEVARAEQSAYEWLLHSAAAVRAGLSDRAVEAIRDGSSVDGLSAREEALRDAARELADSRDLPADVLARVREHVGFDTLSELVVLVGYYQSIALILRVWDVPLPPTESAMDANSRG